MAFGLVYLIVFLRFPGGGSASTAVIFGVIFAVCRRQVDIAGIAGAARQPQPHVLGHLPEISGRQCIFMEESCIRGSSG